ncbi:hypothetical protein MtrunA17_Chr7g0235371 [Medicago truncatula]|uniref:Transmembrane protein n=1 Tax=Medicago truncatula TaxID=3880 RepID=A0A396GXH7_MEDTR|nr:hypothetical protein MtrunA17_Chr7g0235371 [Medicago truncatula]
MSLMFFLSLSIFLLLLSQPAFAFRYDAHRPQYYQAHSSSLSSSP